MSVNRAKKVAAAIPEYPGRRTAEAIARPLVESGPVARLLHAYSVAVALRTLGFWVLWVGLRESGAEDPRRELIGRGWLSRSRAYEYEADFREAWGCSVDEFASTHLGGGRSFASFAQLVTDRPKQARRSSDRR